MVYQIPNILTIIQSHFDENYIWNLLLDKIYTHTIQEFKDILKLIHTPD